MATTSDLPSAETPPSPLSPEEARAEWDRVQKDAVADLFVQALELADRGDYRGLRRRVDELARTAGEADAELVERARALEARIAGDPMTRVVWVACAILFIVVVIALAT